MGNKLVEKKRGDASSSTEGHLETMQESKSSEGFSSNSAGQMGDNIKPVGTDERAKDPMDLTFEKTTKVFGGARADEGEEAQTEEPDDRLERWARFRSQTLENVAQIYTTLRDTPNQPTHQEEMDAVIQTTISLQSIRQAMEDTRGYQALRMMARTELGGQHGQADLLAQNLSMQLYNPRNRCFANSVVRMIRWVPVQRPLEARSIWGQMAETFESILGQQEKVDLAKIETMRSLWEKFPLSRQADASDLLMNISFGKWISIGVDSFRTVTPFGSACHHWFLHDSV